MGIFSGGQKLLSAEDRASLAKLEQVVSDGIKAFAAAGHALQLIRDKQLYREEFETFEDYIANKWTMTRQHAARLISAADVVRHLSPYGLPTPVSERQVRPLTSLKPADQVEAWKEAVEVAPKDERGTPKVSTAAVEAAAAKRRGGKRRDAKVPKPLRVKVPGAIVVVTFNRHFSGNPADAIQAAYAKVVTPQERREVA